MNKFKGTVFVVGASRSGPTILNQILGQHPFVTALNELHYFGDLFNFDSSNAPFRSQRLFKAASKLIVRYRRGLWNDHVNGTDITGAKKLISDIQPTADGVEPFHRFMVHVADETNASPIAEQAPRNSCTPAPRQHQLDFWKKNFYSPYTYTSARN